MKKMIGIVIITLIALSVFILRKEITPVDTDYSQEGIIIAVALNGAMDDGGWGQSHVEGIKNATEDINIEVLWYPNSADAKTHPALIEDAISKGATTIFGVSTLFQDTFYDASIQYPNQYFFVGGGVGESHNFSTYSGKMYQIRYLSGIVAGMETKNNNIGYVVAMEHPEIARGINAFTLGVRSVNPDASVYVTMTGDWQNYDKEKMAAENLIDDYDIDVITLHQDTLAVNEVAEARGIYHIGFHYDHTPRFDSNYLTAAVWDWENYYSTVIRRCTQQTYNSDAVWDDFSSGIVQLSPFSDKVAPETVALVDEAKAKLSNWDVFYGPIYDNEGTLRVREGENLSDQTLLNDMDWYVDGVVLVA